MIQGEERHRGPSYSTKGGRQGEAGIKCAFWSQTIGFHTLYLPAGCLRTGHLISVTQFPHL